MLIAFEQRQGCGCSVRAFRPSAGVVLALACLSAAAALAPAPASGFTSGAWNTASAGCYCHASAVPADLAVDVVGFPPA